MRVVLDTNLIISGSLWHGPPAQLIDLARDGAIEIFTSAAILSELAATLSRAKFEKRIAAAAFSLPQLLSRYADLCTLVEPSALPRLAPDPDDDVVIATAIAAQADFLITGDKPLLFVATYEGGQIIRHPLPR